MKTIDKIRMTVALVACFGLHSATVSAQNWTRFTMQNSELGNSVLAMAADKKNNKWFGTELGMARLSGRTWTDFSMFNEKLKGQYVNCLTVDGSGVIWIGTDDYGVIEFDGTHWTEYKDEMKRLQMKFISKIAIDKNDVKWIGVTLGGLVRFDGREWEKYTAAETGLLSDFILCVAVDRRNRKWIGTNDGLSLYDERRWISYTTQNSGLPHNIVPSVLIDKDDVKWIATLGGLVRFDGTEWKVYDEDNSPLPCNQVNDLAFDPSGALWIVTDKGVALFDREKEWKVYSDKNTPLPADVHRRVMVDSQGCKWFGSSLKGLTRFSAQPIMGRVVDEQGKPLAGVRLTCGSDETQTDKEGRYYLEVATNATVTVTPQAEGRNFEPASLKLATVTGARFGQDFVGASGLVAESGAVESGSTERVVVNPFLEQGYITLSLESAEAEVEFVDAKTGESVRTLPRYRNGARITISKMPRIDYKLFIRTAKGEKMLLFNLK